MYHIRSATNNDLRALKEFTDQEIGKGYYSELELHDVLKKSIKDGLMCSFILEKDGQIYGVRISYPPGNWSHGKGPGLHTDRWPHKLEETAYFQSLFISSSLQGQGWGVRLSQHALTSLREAGAKGVVCHSWKESPNNSSTRYLVKLGFNLVAEHLEYWKDVPYNCTKCGTPPCQCTALEMYLDLANKILLGEV